MSEQPHPNQIICLVVQALRSAPDPLPVLETLTQLCNAPSSSLRRFYLVGPARNLVVYVSADAPPWEGGLGLLHQLPLAVAHHAIYVERVSSSGAAEVLKDVRGTLYGAHLLHTSEDAPSGPPWTYTGPPSP